MILTFVVAAFIIVALVVAFVLGYLFGEATGHREAAEYMRSETEPSPGLATAMRLAELRENEEIERLRERAGAPVIRYGRRCPQCGETVERRFRPGILVGPRSADIQNDVRCPKCHWYGEPRLAPRMPVPDGDPRTRRCCPICRGRLEESSLIDVTDPHPGELRCISCRWHGPVTHALNVHDPD